MLFSLSSQDKALTTHLRTLLLICLLCIYFEAQQCTSNTNFYYFYWPCLCYFSTLQRISSCIQTWILGFIPFFSLLNIHNVLDIVLKTDLCFSFHVATAACSSLFIIYWVCTLQKFSNINAFFGTQKHLLSSCDPRLFVSPEWHHMNKNKKWHYLMFNRGSVRIMTEF